MASVSRKLFLIALSCSVAVAGMARANDAGTANARQPAADALADGFSNPPNSARPRVWWHWLNGNVTREGVDKDIDWLADIGIGGLQNFDANLTTPQIVDRRLVYMTPEWKSVFRHAVERADAKGLEFAIAASPGWSETGGPWVKPADGMKKLTWAEVLVEGGKTIGRPLPALPETSGPFQDLGATELFGDPAGGVAASPKAGGDIAVLAIPVRSAAALQPDRLILGDGTRHPASELVDAALETAIAIPAGSSERPATLDLEFGRAQPVSAARVFIKHARPPFSPPRYTAMLQAEIDGHWTDLADVPLAEASTTVSFRQTTAKRFRLAISPGQPFAGGGLGSVPGAVIIDLFPASSPGTIEVGEFRLFSEPRIEQAEAKAGFGTVPDYHAIDAKMAATGPRPEQVIDITDRLRPDGTLDWTAPRGSRWRIVRLGWSLTGKTNHPATREATGLEVDKYDAAAVERYLDGYLAMYRDAVGPQNLGAKGIRAILTDSIEVGASNWTPRLLEEFRQRRGYDATPWLPALTGVIIASSAESDRFLYDYRRTLAELLADAHYGTVARVAHAQGMKVYGEALEDGRPVLGDDLDMRRHADVPMAALWTFGRGDQPRPGLLGDMKGASSVANFYGQNLVAAESMTSAFSPWAFAPSDLKRVIDLEFAQGVNRPVIHTSVHQPVDDKRPGLSLAIFGQYFNRHETWAGMARPWVDYLSRTGFMLQQGRHHADVAIFYGEESPVTVLFGKGPPAWLPNGYGYDLISARMLGELKVGADGALISPGGARYRAIQLAGTSQRMTLGALNALQRLAGQGARIIGERPLSSPSAADDPAEFQEAVNAVWSRPEVIEDRDIAAGLRRIGLEPDFAVIGGSAKDLRFVHRSLADGDAYFVSNRENRPVTAQVRFRVSGKVPQLWRAVDGKVSPLSYRIEGQTTVVSLDLTAEDAAFVVFRKPATDPVGTAKPVQWRDLGVVGNDWRVAFGDGRGAPRPIGLARLAPLDTHADPAVRYFSGIATYSTTLVKPAGAGKGKQVWLDLGEVADLAEVRINGQMAGTVWFAPYRLDISAFLRPGENRLEVRVANLWVNRLIGDQQAGAVPVTWTAVPTYRPDAPLRRSGLIGPVRLVAPQ